MSVRRGWSVRVQLLDGSPVQGASHTREGGCVRACADALEHRCLTPAAQGLPGTVVIVDEGPAL